MSAKVKWDRGAWWVVTHFEGRRRKKRIGRSKSDESAAQQIAKKINAQLLLGDYRAREPEKKMPFSVFAEEWLRLKRSRSVPSPR